MISHRCHVPNCPITVPRWKLMCGRHWAMVPATIQQAVRRHYRYGQGSFRRPTKAWLTAARRAIDFVIKQEERQHATTSHYADEHL